MAKTRKIIALFLLLGICIPLVLGALGDVELVSNLIIHDDKYIGLENAGRILFDDQSIDEISILDAYFGIRQANPEVLLHISHDATSMSTVEEVVRLERSVEEGNGANGIGASFTVYIENDAGVLTKVGAFEWSLPNAGVDTAPNFEITQRTSEGILPIFRIKTGEAGFYDQTGNNHLIIRPQGCNNNDQILLIKMADGDHTLDFSDASDGDNLYVEAAAKVDQDMTADAEDVTFGSAVLTSDGAPVSATATGTKGQIAFDSKYIYRCVATNTWKRASISNWTESVMLNEDGSKMLDENDEFMEQE